MDIVLLDYYLRLFALLGNLFPYIIPESIKEFLKSSVLKELNQEIKQESLHLFDEYYIQCSSATKEENNQILQQTVRQINAEIPKKQKFHILLSLLLFEKHLAGNSSEGSRSTFGEVLGNIHKELDTDNEEYLNCKSFLSERYYQVKDLRKLLIVSDKNAIVSDLPFLHRRNFKGQLVFLYVENSGIVLFKYTGSQPVTLNKRPVQPFSVYFFNKGSFIRGDNIEPVYYNQVLRRFKMHDHPDLKMEVRNLEFRYKKGSHGIHKLNLTLESEQLIGIIGRSGVGKSTLINLLIGNKKPDKGSITINNLDLNSDNKKLDGLIGYVSQDDLLIEELSVYMNLLLNARLCLGDLTNDVLEEKIKNILADFDLDEVKDMQVGSPLNRLISGGQRKKLNIALELIREPWILFVDEPTSGLSSSDSEEIMQLLSEQTSRGKIVVVNIHQPSSDIFKLFDKIIVLDKEGYPVYFGSPADAIPYFNDYYQRVFLNSDVCDTCENVNPEAIFKVLEEKKTNEFGEFTKKRKTTPHEWHQHFLSQKPSASKYSDTPLELPGIQFKKPGSFHQFIIFCKRNLLTKRANVQYILLTLLISPVLAAVLSSLCRYNNNTDSSLNYLFAYNENIPSYLFMSVIVALFLGLIMSAEEIIKDRKIVLRESYLKLNRLSYINSKVLLVFGISALQTMLYVIIGNAILEINGMIFSFWLLLFSTACFANILGLLISSMLNSVIAIYIMVPLIIVPQMLLSGVVVNFDKINKYLSSQEYVPLVGDLMASRWAYEALVIRQFCTNDYQKYYFETEKEESNVKFNLLFVVPEIKKSLQNLKKSDERVAETNLQFIKNEAGKLREMSFTPGNISAGFSDLNQMPARLEELNQILSEKMDLLSYRRDSITRALVNKFGNTDQYLACKYANYNNSLADIVLKRKELEPYLIANNKIIRQMEPVYQVPQSKAGRAHFLSASKRIGSYSLDTYVFNLIVIWLMSFMIYLFLVFFSYLKQNTNPHYS